MYFLLWDAQKPSNISYFMAIGSEIDLSTSELYIPSIPTQYVTSTTKTKRYLGYQYRFLTTDEKHKFIIYMKQSQPGTQGAVPLSQTQIYWCLFLAKSIQCIYQGTKVALTQTKHENYLKGTSYKDTIWYRRKKLVFEGKKPSLDLSFTTHQL